MIKEEQEEGTSEAQKDKFLVLLNEVYKLDPTPVIIRCETGSQARSLRRKFYRLRDILLPFDQTKASFLIFKLAGRQLQVSLKLDWQNQQNSLENSNAPHNQSLPT